MRTNQFYENANQETALTTRTLLQNEEMEYAAYNSWLGLSEYSTQVKKDYHIESETCNSLYKIRDTYRDYSENMEWKYPGARPFCEQKSFIENSLLFRIFREMPKCSLLHIHNAAGLSLEGLLDLLEHWAEMTPRDHMRPIYVVTKMGGERIPGSLLFDPAVELLPYCEELSQFFRWADARSALGNLLSFSSLDRSESIPYVWDEFNNIFIRAGDLMEDSLFFYMYNYRAFKEMIEDKIEYAELRCSLTAFKDQPDTPQSFEPWNLIERDIPFLDELKIAAEAALTDWNNDHTGETPRKFHFRVILNARRDLDIFDESIVPGKNQGDKMLLKLDSAIIIKQNPKYEDLVCGFDLVSEEDRGKRTYTLYSKGIYENCGVGYREANNIVAGAAMLAANPGLGRLRIQLIDLYLHDGESTWADNDNMMDALVLSAHRIGHGINLSKFPTLVEKFHLMPTGLPGVGEVREPFLEICPISNQMLRYYPDLRMHSAYELIKAGVQCVIGNDDPQILGNPGLSYDFWEAFVGIGLDMNMIKGVVFNAFICEKLADGKFPVVGVDYVLNIAALVAEFNQSYWMPFLFKAHAILSSEGQLVTDIR